MPTFNDLNMFAMARLGAQPVGNHSFSTVFQLPNGRSQKIICSPFKAYNRDWIEFRSAVAPATAIPPVMALQKNAELAVGALAIEKDHYWVLYSALVAGLDTEEFIVPLTLVSTIADKLEQSFSLGDRY